MNKHYDVAIIGAGPAGAACALSLKNTGLSVVLFDKEKFPRDKICGDAIPGPFFKVMDQLNLDWTNALKKDLGRVRISSTLNIIGEHKIVIPWNLYSINCERKIFDSYLMDLVKKNTETTVIEGVKVLEIQNAEAQINISLQHGDSITAGIVIGCDGSNSIVKRKLMVREKTQPYESVAVRCYFDQVFFDQKSENEIYILDELLPGYLWVFPLEDNKANVGIGVLSSLLKQSEHNSSIKEMFKKALNHPLIKERLNGAVAMEEPKMFVLPLGKNKRKISGSRFLLCGDAASLVDPLGGHGIDNAVISGTLAGETIQQCFKLNQFGAEIMSNYDLKVYKKLGERFDVASIAVKYVTKFPFLLSFFAWLLKSRRFMGFAKRYF